MMKWIALIVALGIGMIASAQNVDRYKYFESDGILDTGVSNETANAMVRDGIASGNVEIVNLSIRALGRLSGHAAHDFPSPHGSLPSRSFQQVDGLKRFLMDHWYEQHEKSGYNVREAMFRAMGSKDGVNLELSLADLGLEETDKPTGDDIAAAMQEKWLPWTMIPQILCVFWPGDSDVHTLLWDFHSRDRSPEISLTILLLLNTGKFTMDEDNAFRIDQLNGVGELAGGAAMLAAEGLALSRPVDALPSLVSAAQNHAGARGDILVTIAGYEDDELAPYVRELAPLVNVNRANVLLGAEQEALDRLKSFVK